jgi:hypothetical protein
MFGLLGWLPRAALLPVTAAWWCKPVSNPYRTDFMDLRIHDMDYGFTIWIYGSTDFTDFE